MPLSTVLGERFATVQCSELETSQTSQSLLCLQTVTWASAWSRSAVGRNRERLDSIFFFFVIIIFAAK